MWQIFIHTIEQGLLFFNHLLSVLGVPYSFGFAIILFTLAIKGLTYPLNMKQIKASKAQQDLQPKLKALQEKYSDDREELARAQMTLYKEHGINPLGGCLPMLVQMPIWMGLYRALFALAKQPNSPLTEGFFWIPSLVGPVELLNGSPIRSIDWLLPNSDMFLGWGNAIAYLILPVLLVISQLYTQRMTMPKTDDSQQKAMSQLMTFMPLMFGYFALVVPSGLSLYWFTSNILSMIQQYFITKSRNAETHPTKEETVENGQLASAQSESNSPGTRKQVETKRKRTSKSKKKRKRKK